MSFEAITDYSNYESIEAEEGLLLEIQNTHQALLESTGILDAARDAIPDFYNIFSPNLTRAFVTKVAATHDLNNPNVRIAMVPGIRFCGIVPETLHGFNKEKRVFESVRLADLYEDGNIWPNPGFSLSDVELASQMLNGLEEAKKRGLLPNLNSHLTAIRNPRDPRSRHPSSNF